MGRSRQKETGIHKPVQEHQRQRHDKPRKQPRRTEKEFKPFEEDMRGMRVTQRHATKTDGLIHFYMGWQCWELVDLAMKKWGCGRSEAARRLLLPLGGPFKKALRDGRDVVHINHTYSLDPDAYGKYTIR